MMGLQLPRYSCFERIIDRFPTFHDDVWEDLPKMMLYDTETGEIPSLSTVIEIFWDRYREALYFRFVCDDDYILSTMTDHDDPLYEEDVVEVFICETGELHKYKEFEVSPTNVKFDAIIYNAPPRSIEVIPGWDAIGWNTNVFVAPNQSKFISVWEIKLANFIDRLPRKSEEWRINCYRIDRGKETPDQYMAWSPTGALNFHIPSRFGTLRFE